MNPEEIVKKIFPDARCVYSMHSGLYMIYFEMDSYTQHIEWMASKQKAWDEACKYLSSLALNVSFKECGLLRLIT